VNVKALANICTYNGTRVARATMTMVNGVLLIVLVASLGVPAAHGKAADEAAVLCALDVCHGSDSAVSSVADASIMHEC
jgi:hypothetical protein